MNEGSKSMSDHHNLYGRLSDEDLLAKIARTRDMAGNAPKAVDNPSDAWARHGAEWARLRAEARRRGLLEQS